MRTIVLAFVLTFTCVACWSADWLGEGNDPQRSAWQKDEKTISTANAKDIKLIWKLRLDSTPREMHNLFPPLIFGSVNTASGAKQIAVVAGVSDDLFGVDVATGTQLWKTHFDSTYTPATGGRGGGTLCPGGQTAAPVAGPGPTAGSYTIYAVGWDGRLHEVNAADGKELVEPMKFTVANGKPYALNLFNNVIYTSTAQGCGGHPDLLYAYDLRTNRTSVFSPGGGGMWGRRGVAVSPNGVVYMGTGDAGFDASKGILGDSIVGMKLDIETDEIHLDGYYSPINSAFMWKRDLDMNDSPTVFDYQGKHFVVSTSKECRLWLMDRDNMGGDDHRTPLYRTPQFCNDDINYAGAGVWGGMANYVDSKGVQWVLVPYWGPVSVNFHAPFEYGRPTRGGVAAFKVQQVNGKWELTPGWLSENMNMGEEVLVANGVVFAYGSGEDTRQGREERAWNDPPDSTPQGGSAGRIANSTHATLFALDGQTGKTLWSSGDQITSWNHFSGISEANGRVYIPTFDGYVYCFGITQ